MQPHLDMQSPMAHLEELCIMIGEAVHQQNEEALGGNARIEVDTACGEIYTADLSIVDLRRYSPAERGFQWGYVHAEVGTNSGEIGIANTSIVDLTRILQPCFKAQWLLFGPINPIKQARWRSLAKARRHLHAHFVGMPHPRDSAPRHQIGSLYNSLRVSHTSRPASLGQTLAI